MKSHHPAVQDALAGAALVDGERDTDGFFRHIIDTLLVEKMLRHQWRAGGHDGWTDPGARPNLGF